ncbi:MAG: flagellar biosynthesis repressor FlbT [Alphaproteobacteria bacterium]
MSGLLISLKPNEKFLVNGALLTNGPKRGQIQVGDDVNVLRLSDAIHPDEATTPLKRLYYSIQIILSCDALASDVQDDIQNGLDDLIAVFENTPVLKTLEKAKKSAAVGRYYSVLCALKTLLKLENELLSRSISIPNPGNGDCAERPRVAMSA